MITIGGFVRALSVGNPPENLSRLGAVKTQGTLGSEGPKSEEQVEGVPPVW